jgi:hypothetical protein
VSSNPTHGRMYSIQHYVIKFISGLPRVLRFPPRYNWNIVESGIKHHKPNQTKPINLWKYITMQNVVCFSSPSLIKLHLLHWKIDLQVRWPLLRGPVFLYLTISEHLKSDPWWEGPYKKGTIVTLHLCKESHGNQLACWIYIIKFLRNRKLGIIIIVNWCFISVTGL